MEYIALFIILLALFLLWQARRQRDQAGLPGGRVIFSDTSQWAPQERPLYSAEIGLTGKPDYLVEVGRHTIPVEVKKVNDPDRPPYDTHIYQLAAYCLLVAEQFEQRPPYGIIHYTNGQHGRSYAIDFTPALEAAVRQIITEIQGISRTKELARSHDQPQRCQGCGYRQSCDQALTR